MSRWVKLSVEFDIGTKVLEPGQIVSFDRRTMDKLVKEGRAFYCSSKGLRLPTPSHLISDEEE